MVYEFFLKGAKSLEQGEIGSFAETMDRQINDSWEWRNEELDHLADKLASLAKIQLDEIK